MVFLLLKFAIKDFRDDREFKNLSPKTVESYFATLYEFQAYCGEQKIIDVSDITPNTIKNFLQLSARIRSN